MVIRLLVLVGLVLVGAPTFSQKADSVKKEAAPVKKKSFRPDIPGNIIVEFGFNFKNGVVPADFQKSFWGSRTVNFYYQYPIRLFKTKFSVVPGVGLSLERFKLSNNYTLPFTADPDGTYPLIPGTDIYPGSIERSFIVNNYVEAPIELRFDTNPDDIARSVSVSFGYRIGLLYDSFTKVDYLDKGEDKTMKDIQRHGINLTRQTLYGRVGYGGFGLVLYYNTTPLFAPGKGPEKTAMNSITIGITVSGF